MGPFGTGYAYLGFSAMLLVASGTLALVLPGRRHALAVAGVLAAPAGVLDIFFIPAYWQPVTMFATPVGPEDLLFSFAVGVISCGLAFGRTAPSQTAGSPLSVSWGRYAAIVAGYVIWMAVVTRATDIRVMDAAVAGMVMVGGTLIWRTPALLWPGLRGAVLFGGLYVLALLGAFELWPGLASQWSPSAASGARVLSVPSGEIAWALVYGGVYPVLFASVTDVQLAVETPTPARPGHGPLLDIEPDGRP